MPRTARAAVANMAYHVINRGNAKATVFHDDDDFAAFVRLIGEASERIAMRLAAYCVMPTIFISSSGRRTTRASARGCNGS